MTNNLKKQTFIEKKITYTFDVAGKTLIMEDVPAIICVETGEQFFSAETQKLLQQTALAEIKKTLLGD